MLQELENKLFESEREKVGLRKEKGSLGDQIEQLKKDLGRREQEIRE